MVGNKHSDRYHISYADKRTTITVDTMLSELLAIKLKQIPETAEAHAAVRGWLQETLIRNMGDYSAPGMASHFARRYLIEFIADKRLIGKWHDWQGG